MYQSVPFSVLFSVAKISTALVRLGGIFEQLFGTLEDEV